MNTLRLCACRCMVLSGMLTLLCGYAAANNAPVPPPVKVTCDDSCRMLPGPFQAGLKDDTTATCWIYDTGTCNNCQVTKGSWACTGDTDPAKPQCVQHYIDIPPFGPVEDTVGKSYIAADANNVKCKKKCDIFTNGTDGQLRVQVGQIDSEIAITFVNKFFCDSLPPTE